MDKVPGAENAWITGMGQAEGFKFSIVLGEYAAWRVMGNAGDPAIAEARRAEPGLDVSSRVTPRARAFGGGNVAPGAARASLLRCLLRVGTLAEPRLREDPAPRAQALLHQRSRDGHVDAVGQPERAHAPREKAGGAVVHEHGTRRAGQRDRLGGDVRQR